MNCYKCEAKTCVVRRSGDKQEVNAQHNNSNESQHLLWMVNAIILIRWFALITSELASSSCQAFYDPKSNQQPPKKAHNYAIY